MVEVLYSIGVVMAISAVTFLVGYVIGIWAEMMDAEHKKKKEKLLKMECEIAELKQKILLGGVRR